MNRIVGHVLGYGNFRLQLAMSLRRGLFEEPINNVLVGVEVASAYMWLQRVSCCGYEPSRAGLLGRIARMHNSLYHFKL